MRIDRRRQERVSSRISCPRSVGCCHRCSPNSADLDLVDADRCRLRAESRTRRRQHALSLRHDRRRASRDRSSRIVDVSVDLIRGIEARTESTSSESTTSGRRTRSLVLKSQRCVRPGYFDPTEAMVIARLRHCRQNTRGAIWRPPASPGPTRASSWLGSRVEPRSAATSCARRLRLIPKTPVVRLPALSSCGRYGDRSQTLLTGTSAS